MNIASILEDKIKNGQEEFGKLYGVYAGQVADNQDPEHLFRLKVKLPEVFGTATSDWALPRGVFSGNQYGFYALPQPKDNVWVTFRNGDARYPLWEYGAVAKGHKPSEAQGTALVLQSKNGNKIIIQEDGTIRLSNGDYTLKELITALFDWLETSQVLTPNGLGKFAPDSLIQLTEIKSKIDTLLS